MSDLTGKVALITGAARGQGRAHALRLAQAGADIIAIDVCRDVPTIPYPMATRADLDEVAGLIEKLDRRVSAQVADVSDLEGLEAAYRAGIGELGAGHVDIVVANAGGIAYPTEGADEAVAFKGQLDVMLVGTWNTLKVTVTDMIAAGAGGAIVLTSSSASLKGFVGGWGGLDGYTAAKSGILGLMKVYANLLAKHSIRVNSVHPTGVDSGMTQNPAFFAWVQASLAEGNAPPANAMPVAVLQPDDIAAAVSWLVSDDAKWVTGVALPVDAGFANK
jgi:SDR family mycofactocin-dependent oxidoreductase